MTAPRFAYTGVAMKRQTSPEWQPVLAALGGVALLSVMDAFMKGASLAVGAYSAALLRVVFACAMATPVWLAMGGRRPSRAVLPWHIARGVVSAFMGLTFFFALTRLPIAEAIAISFVAPILALYLASLFLGEKIGREAIVAALLGFAGTLVIIGGKLGRANLSDGVLEGLAAIIVSALLYAGNFIIMRKQSLAAGPLEIAAFHSGIQTLVLGVAAPFLLVWPPGGVLGALGASAVLTVGGALLLAWAYGKAETQRLIPLEYSSFVWAVILGWVYFSENLEWTTVAGVVLIVAGCWIASRARTGGAAAVTPPAEPEIAPLRSPPDRNRTASPTE